MLQLHPEKSEQLLIEKTMKPWKLVSLVISIWDMLWIHSCDSWFQTAYISLPLTLQGCTADVRLVSSSEQATTHRTHWGFSAHKLHLGPQVGMREEKQGSRTLKINHDEFILSVQQITNCYMEISLAHMETSEQNVNLKNSWIYGCFRK